MARFCWRRIGRFITRNSPSISGRISLSANTHPTPEAPQPEDQIIAEGISEEVRESLRKIFQEDIEALQEITGRDLSHWQ